MPSVEKIVDNEFISKNKIREKMKEGEENVWSNVFNGRNHS